MAFDRLVTTVDAWAAKHPDVEVFAQIGLTDFVPRHMEWEKLLDPVRYAEVFAKAEVVVSHAGMGTVISAAEQGKPLLLLPRLGALRETRNDHQVATARWLAERPGIWVAMSENELASALDARARLTSKTIAGSTEAEPRLIKAIRDFISDT